MMNERRYPVGIQTFSEIINGGYVYVDKTDLMWQMQRLSKYIFLSRPRRFGKSLLTTTLCSFFEGRKDLFKGLKVMELEREWQSYPVI
ncbi:MAG: AAA family ATPase, partial [Bacteroidaceae bacterium]|nr:AAA family ATPase [Bacteroidaceae bacterium]